MAMLLLRGPQTLAELNTRTERQHEFASFDEVESVLQDLADTDRELLDALLARYGIPGRYDFKKVVAGRKLWNFSKKEMGVWIQAL